MELVFFSGYIRNAEALGAELGLHLSMERKALEREILRRGFECWGKELCAHLYGAFSFAIMDPSTETLYCARDQFGITPFFYHLTEGGELLFSDDIREIAKHPDYKRALNPHALRVYLMLGYPAGTGTLFAGIEKLGAGHWLTFHGGKITLERYYKLTYAPDESRSEADWMEAIEKTALEVIAEDQTHPQYANAESFLSGGVDSSYLLALSGLSSACSIGYADNAYDESRLAQHTAELLERNFRKRMVTKELYFDTIPKVVSALGLPLADVSSIVFYLGCEDVASRTSLCFSGEGADELFAGYWLYQRANELAWEDGPLHLGCSGAMTQECAELLLLDKLPEFSCEPLVRDIYKETKDSEHLSRLLAMDVSLFLEANIMFGLSRSSAAHGLQVRTPFADRRMFELAAKIPSDLKLHDGVGKYILRCSAEKRLPHEIAFRKKVGFSVPVCPWMREPEIRKRMEEVLFGETSKMVFCQGRLARWWNTYQNGDDSLRSLVFAVYIFLIWYEMWF